MPTPIVIDTDSHFIEPPDLWTSRLPKSWDKDRVLHIEWNDKTESEVWCIGGRQLTERAWSNVTHNMPVTLPLGPAHFQDADPANWEIKARLAEMDKVGIRAQLLYPNIGGFWCDPFVNNPDEELSIAHNQIYNDYLIEWAEPAPDRFVPLATLPYWNLKQAIREVERVATTHKGVILSGAPHRHQQPCLADRHWDPLWQAISDAGLPISFHVANVGHEEIFSADRLAAEGQPTSYARSTTQSFLTNAVITNDLLLSGILPRFPKLKFVIVESGIGWIPFVLESADLHFKLWKIWNEHPEWGDLLPSDVFRRQVFVNYWFEKLEPWHVEKIGAENILFETDFPHPTHIWGQTVTNAINALDNLSQEIRDNVLWRNATRLYNLAEDPIATSPST